jgi:hypothetical protein
MWNSTLLDMKSLDMTIALQHTSITKHDVLAAFKFCHILAFKFGVDS